jgi:hypothetical protein
VTVLLVGDSIMRELSGAVQHGIEQNGVDDVAFVLGPALPHTPTDLAVWRSFLARHEPDVVVLHVGHWERLKVLGDFATGALLAPGSYRAEVVDPALDLIRDAGAPLLWISPIPVRDREEAAFIEALADDFVDAAQDRGDVTFLDVGPVIAPGGFTETLPGAGGRPEQIRRSDGAHLCPAGQLLVARAVIDQLEPELSAPVPAGWESAWRRQADEPGGCRPTFEPTPD